MIEESYFENGERHGSYQTWWSNGKPKEKGQYFRGAKVGSYQWYDSDGTIVEEQDFGNGT